MVVVGLLAGQVSITLLMSSCSHTSCTRPHIYLGEWRRIWSTKTKCASTLVCGQDYLGFLSCWQNCVFAMCPATPEMHCHLYRWPNGLGPMGRTNHSMKKYDPNPAQPSMNSVSADPTRYTVPCWAGTPAHSAGPGTTRLMGWRYSAHLTSGYLSLPWPPLSVSLSLSPSLVCSLPPPARLSLSPRRPFIGRFHRSEPYQLSHAVGIIQLAVFTHLEKISWIVFISKWSKVPKAVHCITLIHGHRIGCFADVVWNRMRKRSCIFVKIHLRIRVHVLDPFL